MTQTVTSQRTPIKILVIDDEPIFRQGLRALLEPFADQVAIAGEATNANEAIKLVQELKPDLVLLDLRLPEFRGVLSEPEEKHGLTAIRMIKQVRPKTHILVLSGVELRKYQNLLFQALREGADGYIAKVDRFDAQPLADAIQRIVAGEAIYGPTVAPLIRQHFQRRHEAHTPLASLSRRELQVLKLIESGKTDKEIAKELVIGLTTAKTHVRHILNKLHIDSRHEVHWIRQSVGDERDMS